MNILNYMMPTQAPNAIIIDGSILIIVGAIIVAYLLYKHRHELLDIDKEACIDTLPNTNIQTVNEENHQFDRTNLNNNSAYAQRANVDENRSIESSNTNGNENIDNTIDEYNSQKEVILNYR